MLSKDPEDSNHCNSKIPEVLQFMVNPHLSQGRDLENQGLLREAIEEYEKEHNRNIITNVDADIVQQSYWRKGRAYRKLGEAEKAIEALQKSREVLMKYGMGPSPDQDLAEIFLEQGRLDEAINIIQESLDQIPSWPMKQLLIKAMELKTLRDQNDEEKKGSDKTA